MEFTIPLNKFEKEQRVITLHSSEGKTIREISKEVHMSFRDISKIIKVYEKKVRLQQNKGENSQSNQKIKKPSISSQAYGLFLQGKRPVDVAIDLTLDFKKVRKYWTEYLRLKNMTKLYNIYIQNEYHLDYLFKVYYFMLRNEVSIIDTENILKTANDILTLNQIHSNLKREIEKLKQTKSNYSLNQQTMRYHQLPQLGPLPRYYNW